MRIKRKSKIPPDVKIAEWLHGPWVREPDEVEFVYLGIQCRLIRISEPAGKGKRQFLHGGHWSGFVAVPKEHPDYGTPFVIQSDILGGIKIDLPSDKDHWIGIIADNSTDYIPSKEKTIKSWMGNMRPQFGDKAFDDPIYRDVDFMIKQVQLLAEQIKGEINGK